MYLKEFYDEIGGSYQTARRRFFTDAMLLKFLGKFLEEPCYTDLCDALDHNDRNAAIHAAHTLASQARGFGFTELEKNSAALMQALRCEDDPAVGELRDRVMVNYCAVARRLRSLER